MGTRPLAIDLYCGLGGWTEGLLAAGFDVIGFDIEQHVYGADRYPAQLVVQDVLTLHGSQFKTAYLIVASPPYQQFSFSAMPFKASKAIVPSTELFDACFRIQREASEAARRPIPMVVENVRGAVRWVGQPRWNCGAYYLWGDVPALMPPVQGRKLGGSWFHGYRAGAQGPRNHGSGSKARKAASAKIAKIPFALAEWIGRAWMPYPDK